MKIHPQYITEDGLPTFVVLPYEEYESLLDKLEEIEDIQAVELAKADKSERFPLELVEELASGKNAIKVFREYRKLPQSHLAKTVGVSRQYIFQIENDERAGTTRVLKKIAKILGVDLEDIC